jgi:hypothetical protein
MSDFRLVLAHFTLVLYWLCCENGSVNGSVNRSVNGSVNGSVIVSIIGFVIESVIGSVIRGFEFVIVGFGSVIGSVIGWYLVQCTQLN